MRVYCNRFVYLSVCLSMLKLAFSKFIRFTSDTTYQTHNKGEKFCGIFSEIAPFQSQSPSSNLASQPFPPPQISACAFCDACAEGSVHCTSVHSLDVLLLHFTRQKLQD